MIFEESWKSRLETLSEGFYAKPNYIVSGHLGTGETNLAKLQIVYAERYDCEER